MCVYAYMCVVGYMYMFIICMRDKCISYNTICIYVKYIYTHYKLVSPFMIALIDLFSLGLTP